jgi:NAD-reducing hydrogenase large subunit
VHDIHTIDPVTRIEGHAKITLHLGDDGEVADARFHVTEFRGFEEFCKGRPVAEMPGLTARTCGICPVSHLIAASKAGDAIYAVTPPPAAIRQRRLLNLGQILQSHSLSFFHLSAPDLLLGMDHDPATRNVFGLMQAEPEIARRGIRLRQFGQEVIAAVAGQRIHGSLVVPGGVARPFTTEMRDRIVADLDEMMGAATATLELLVSVEDRFERELHSFGEFDSIYVGHCLPDGTWEHIDGKLRIMAADGSMLVDQLDPHDYREVFGEAGKTDSYLKSPYYRPFVDGDDPRPGMYRVGPLARINLAERFGTPVADEGLAAFRERYGRIARSSFLYHHARVLEVIACVERIAASWRTRSCSSQGPLAGRHQRAARRRCLRGPPWHPDPRLRGRRQRADHRDEPDHRDRAERPGRQPDDPRHRPRVRRRAAAHRRDAQPHRGRGPRLRPVPVVLHPRGRADADGGVAVAPDGETLAEVRRD